MNEPIKPFRFWVQNVLPQVYDDSLSYYELLNKVVYYLNEVISATNSTVAEVDRLNREFEELKEYIDNYFDSTDFKDKIEDVLDDMLQDGELAPIVQEAIEEFLAEFEGRVETLEGKVETLEDNEILTVAGVGPESNKDVAVRKLSKELNKPSVYNVLDYGAVGDGETDNFQALNDLLTLVYESGGGIVYFPRGQYNISNNLCIGDNTTIKGDGYDSFIYMTIAGNYSGEVLCCYGSHILIEDIRVDFLNSSFIFDGGGDNMGIVGICTGSLDDIGSYETPHASDVSVEDIVVRRLYSDATYVCQSETKQDTATISGVVYEDIDCDGVLSVVTHKANEIFDVSIRNCVCQGIRITAAGTGTDDAYKSHGIFVSNCVCNWLVSYLSGTIISNLQVFFFAGQRGYDYYPNFDGIITTSHTELIKGLRVIADSTGNERPRFVLKAFTSMIVSDAIFELYDAESTFLDVIHSVTSAAFLTLNNVTVPSGSSNTSYGRGSANFSIEGCNSAATFDRTLTLAGDWSALSPTYFPIASQRYGNIVKISGAIYKATAGYSNGESIGTISYAARPSAVRYAMAVGFDRTDYSKPHNIVVKIATNGTITIDGRFDHARSSVDAIFLDFDYLI